MIDAKRLSDEELVEALDLAAPRIRLAGAPHLRQVSDILVGLALEAAARLRELAGDRVLLELRARASRLEDAAFHFQTCATCRTRGDSACSSGVRYAAYLRGETYENGIANDPTCRPSRPPDPMAAKVRHVVIHADGRLTCELEIADAAAGARFVDMAMRGRT